MLKLLLIKDLENHLFRGYYTGNNYIRKAYKLYRQIGHGRLTYDFYNTKISRIVKCITPLSNDGG